MKRRFWIPLSAGLALSVAFLSGFMVQRALPGGRDSSQIPSQPAPDFSLIQEAWGIIDRNYVDRPSVQGQSLTYGAIGGMVDALGDTGHSRFLTPDMVQREHSFMEGKYVGVGLEIGMKDGRATIVAPLDGSPAFKAGLRAGQQIIKVDGAGVAELTIEQVVQRIVGPAGTTVTLSLFDPASSRNFDVPLKRAEITLNNVSWQFLPGSTVADIRVAAFCSGVTDAVKSALLKAQAGGCTGLVFDLRNDPGGELGEAVGVASQFLKEGDVLLEKDAQGALRSFRVRRGGTALTVPLVVLVNSGTASAAEIVAGALQDANRATILGETTYGTGTVLQFFDLSDGSQLLLAVKEWLTPKGRTIWHKGIVPDLPVPLPSNGATLVPSVISGMTREGFQSFGDTQLLKAAEILSR